MKITRKEVEYAARLARLKLTDAEKDEYTVQLEAILGHIDQLSKLDTKNVPPTSHAIPLKNVFREDLARKSSDEMRESILSNAPERDGNYFKVKKVIG